MPSLFSTQTLRRPVTKIPVEFCPRLTIAELANYRLLGGDHPRFFGLKRVEGRIDLAVRAHLQNGNHHLEVQSVPQNGAEKGWRNIELSPRSSRRTRYPYRFICQGKRLEGGKSSSEKFAGCGKRVDVLYIPDSEGICFLACRACHGLTYASRRFARKAKKPRLPRQPRLTPKFTPFTPPGTSHDAFELPIPPDN